MKHRFATRGFLLFHMLMILNIICFYLIVHLLILFMLDFIVVFVLTGIGCMSWSPLACGILTGKYDDGVPIYSRAALKVFYLQKSMFLIIISTLNGI